MTKEAIRDTHLLSNDDWPGEIQGSPKQRYIKSQLILRRIDIGIGFNTISIAVIHTATFIIIFPVWNPAGAKSMRESVRLAVTTCSIVFEL